MTLEEAIAWCRERLLSINFTTPDDKDFPSVSIMNKHGIVDEILGEGNSIEEAVQDAINNGNDGKPKKQGMFVPGFMADMLRNVDL